MQVQRFTIIGKLGDGSYGDVHQAIDQHSGNILAIKHIKKTFPTWDHCLALKEVKSLQKIIHPHVIRLQEVLRVNQELYLVFEYADSNLLQVIESKKLTCVQIKKLIYQALSGLVSVHAAGFFHRDIKPENILIKDNQVKLCDFGLAREVRSKPPLTEYISTRWYRAPEQILYPGYYSSAIDVFALGCVFYEMFTGLPLFPGSSNQDQLMRIVKVLGRVSSFKGRHLPDNPSGLQCPATMSKDGFELLKLMLTVTGKHRPSAHQLMCHEYFKQEIVPEIKSYEPVKFGQSTLQAFAFPKELKKIEPPRTYQLRKSIIKNQTQKTSKKVEDSWALLEDFLEEIKKDDTKKAKQDKVSDLIEELEEEVKEQQDCELSDLFVKKGPIRKASSLKESCPKMPFLEMDMQIRSFKRQ